MLEELETAEIKPSELPDPWDRRPDEGAKAFKAFEVYLALAERRSALKVSQKCAVHQNLIKRWSARHCWVERAQLFDNEQAKRRLERLAIAREKLVDAQVRAAGRMMAVVEASLPRLARRKLNAQDAARMFVAALKSLQAVFGEDEPLSERQRDIKVVVQTNVPRFNYDYSKLPADLRPLEPKGDA